MKNRAQQRKKPSAGSKRRSNETLDLPPFLIHPDPSAPMRCLTPRLLWSKQLSDSLAETTNSRALSGDSSESSKPNRKHLEVRLSAKSKRSAQPCIALGSQQGW
jgi:hypothetical protein